MSFATWGPRRACASVVFVAAVVAGCSAAEPARSPRPLPAPRIQDGVTLMPGSFTGRAVPASGAAGQGVLYRFQFGSHCGIAFWLAWDFDGSFWDPVAGTADGAAMDPPDGIDNPVDRGTIELTGPYTARYTSSHGVVVDLRRSPDREREGMLCM